MWGWGAYLMWPVIVTAALTQAITAVLVDWWEALEDGSVTHRFPAAHYEKTWTEEELAALFKNLDVYCGNQRDWLRSSQGIHTDADPGLSRLAYVQQIALAQELHRILKEHDALQTEEERREDPPTVIKERISDYIAYG